MHDIMSCTGAADWKRWASQTLAPRANQSGKGLHVQHLLSASVHSAFDCNDLIRSSAHTKNKFSQRGKNGVFKIKAVCSVIFMYVSLMHVALCSVIFMYVSLMHVALCSAIFMETCGGFTSLRIQDLPRRGTLPQCSEFGSKVKLLFTKIC